MNFPGPLSAIPPLPRPRPAGDTRIRRGDPVRHTGQRVCGIRGCMTRHTGSNTGQRVCGIRGCMTRHTGSNAGYVTRTYWFGRWARVRWTLGVPTRVRTRDLIRIEL